MLQHLAELWTHTTDTSDPDDNASLGSTGTWRLPDFLTISNHLNLSSVHLPIFLVKVLSFFIDKLPPCLSKYLLGKLLSQALNLQLAKFLYFFLRVSGTSGTFFSSAPSMVPA